MKRDVNHRISKAIVSKAKGTARAIALEDLSGIIRSRVTVGRKHRNRGRGSRDRCHKWAFHELRTFAEYNAVREGVRVWVVSPRNTSRKCPRCLHVDARNRPSRDLFRCVACGYEAMADYVAATNIAARAAFFDVNQPIVAPLFQAVTSPHHSGLGS